MIPFNYHHLYYFYTIAEEGSVTRAANKLRIAQSSLSMQLAQLEKFFDCKLFIREGKKMILTDKGRHILEYAKGIFDLGEELADSLSDRADKDRLRIQIGVSSFVSKTVIDEVLKFLLGGPGKPIISLSVAGVDELIQQLQIHKLDMILSDLPCRRPADQGLESYLLARIPVIFCADKRLASKVRRFPEDLSKIPLILSMSPSRIYHAIHEYFLFHGIRPDIIAEVQDLELVRRLVLAGHGAAPMNLATAHRRPAGHSLRFLCKPARLGIDETVYLVRKKRRIPHPLVDSVLKEFKMIHSTKK